MTTTCSSTKKGSAGKAPARNILRSGKKRPAGARHGDFYRLLADNARDLLFSIRVLPDVYYEYVSPSSTQITGYTPEEFYADPDLAKRCIHPDDYKSLTDFTNIDEPRGRDHVIIRWKRKDGRTILTEHTATVTRDESGKAVSIQIIARDITEQTKAIEALKESQEFTFSLLNNAPHATMVINPDTSIRYVNPSWEKLNGWTLDEIKGAKIPHPWWPEEQKEDLMVAFPEVFKQETGQGPFYAQKKNGERYWIDINWVAVTRDNEMQYLLINSIDITERKRSEEELAKEAIRRRILIEQSSDGIVILDQNGKVYEANRRFAEMLGYSPEEVLELHLWDWDTQWSKEQLLHKVRTVGEGGDHLETFHRRKDGTTFDVEISTNGATFGGQKLVFCVCRDISKRKQAEKALAESEEKFAKAFHASPTNMAITTLADGRFIDVNNSTVIFSGYTREELIGRTIANLNTWTDPEDRHRMLRIVEEKGSIRDEEFEFLTKSGEIHTCLFSADVIDVGGEKCLISSMSDITERKRAETQIRLLSSITQQVSDATVITDLDFRIIYINQAAGDLLGFSIDEVRGEDLEFYNTDPLSEAQRQYIIDTVSKGNAWTGTAAKRTKDGRVLICEGKLSPLYDENGRISSYIYIFHDVTERKMVEAKLQMQNQLIERILATMPEGVLVINSADRIVLANEAFYQIFDLDHEAIEDKSLGEAVPKRQLLTLYNGVKRGKAGSNSVEFRHQVNDQEKIITCNIAKMAGEQTLLTFTDISREREEKEKLYLTDRLASIGEMAAGLAHELNNPLTGILTLSQLLIESDIPDEHREDLQCVFDEAQRAASIVKNVLLFTRNNNYVNGQASVNEVVQNVLRLREYEEKVSNITVTTRCQNDLPDVAMDKFQLQQVFLNLILNAEAAIREIGRPGKLIVTTEQVNNHVNVIFKDNGCGIKKHIIPHIFDPFFTTKDIGKGTGLGLSICYGIVVKHGGKISVKSRFNQGATFTIRIPVAT